MRLLFALLFAHSAGGLGTAKRGKGRNCHKIFGNISGSFFWWTRPPCRRRPATRLLWCSHPPPLLGLLSIKAHGDRGADVLSPQPENRLIRRNQGCGGWGATLESGEPVFMRHLFFSPPGWRGRDHRGAAAEPSPSPPDPASEIYCPLACSSSFSNSARNSSIFFLMSWICSGCMVPG